VVAVFNIQKSEIKSKVRKRSKRELASKRFFLICALSLIMFLSLVPDTAFAQSSATGWSELERYTAKRMGANSGGYIASMELAKQQYGRELTASETETWKKCIDAQAAYDEAWNAGRDLSISEKEALNTASEAVLIQSKDEIAAIEAYHKYSMPEAPSAFEPILVDDSGSAQTDALAIGQATNDPTVQAMPQQIDVGSGLKLDTQTSEKSPNTNVAISDTSNVAMSSGSSTSWSPGGVYTTPIGVYPSAPGTILITNDWYNGFLPTGHAAMMINSSEAYTALSQGVCKEKNDWGSSTSSS